MALARLFGLVMVAVIITFTTAQNATTSIPGSVQGYYKVPNNDAWFTISCMASSRVYVSTAGYGRCCDNPSSCDFATSCSDGTLLYVDGDYTCDTSESCHTMTIYESDTTGPTVRDIFCYPHWGASTIFRQTAAPTSSSAFHSTSAPTPGSSVTTSLATPTDIPAKEPDSNSSGSSSKAWIAGAVIGPVAGLALVLGLGFWVYRRRTRQRREEPPVHTGTVAEGPYGSKVQGPMSELAGSEHAQKPHQPPSELPAS